MTIIEMLADVIANYNVDFVVIYDKITNEQVNIARLTRELVSAGFVVASNGESGFTFSFDAKDTTALVGLVNAEAVYIKYCYQHKSYFDVLLNANVADINTNMYAFLYDKSSWSIAIYLPSTIKDAWL